MDARRVRGVFELEDLRLRLSRCLRAEGIVEMSEKPSFQACFVRLVDAVSFWSCMGAGRSL